ncbi:MAG: hypothetical protein ABL984_11335 [Pyrinomonadaceae bacterium]
MDISSLGIPNIRTTKVGSQRDGVEIVEAVVRLEAWDGYLVKRWEYPTTFWENVRAIADGTIVVRFACGRDSSPQDWDTQVAAYHRLLDEQFDIRDSIVNHLRENFDTLKETYYLDPDDDPDVPRITESNKHDFDLRPFIGPQSVSITDHEEKDGIPYLQWSLNCNWDEEHGLAAVTHGTRVIDLDRGETDIYKVFADNGTLEQELKEAEKYKNMRGTRKQKPWWQFW